LAADGERNGFADFTYGHLASHVHEDHNPSMPMVAATEKCSASTGARGRYFVRHGMEVLLRPNRLPVVRIFEREQSQKRSTE